jgi:hypothetical protein
MIMADEPTRQAEKAEPAKPDDADDEVDKPEEPGKPVLVVVGLSWCNRFWCWWGATGQPLVTPSSW